MSEAEDPGLLALAERIAGRSGLDLGAYKDRCIRRRIAARMRACGVHNYREYLQVIDLRPAELDLLVDALTINVTKFFRNRETWDWLGDHILPTLFQAGTGPLRVWSAGCASGEEAYTLVMLAALVLERLGRPDWLSRVQVDATDIDRASLRLATAGRYASRAFSDADPNVAKRFCEALQDGELEVLPSLRSHVTVSRLDLISDPLPTVAYDLICCRNVVIYFDRATQDRLMHRLADALRPGGVLVLGKVETILGGARARFELVEPRERIYRKAA